LPPDLHYVFFFRFRHVMEQKIVFFFLLFLWFWSDFFSVSNAVSFLWRMKRVFLSSTLLAFDTISLGRVTQPKKAGGKSTSLIMLLDFDLKMWEWYLLIGLYVVFRLILSFLIFFCSKTKISKPERSPHRGSYSQLRKVLVSFCILMIRHRFLSPVKWISLMFLWKIALLTTYVCGHYISQWNKLREYVWISAQSNIQLNFYYQVGDLTLTISIDVFLFF